MEEDTLRDELEARLEAAFGFAVPVILRRAGDLAAVIAGNPFPDAEPDPAARLVPARHPPPGATDGIDAAAFAPEEFVLPGARSTCTCPAAPAAPSCPRR